jgi:hypothetical protein
MKINFLKAIRGTERELEAIEDIPKFQKIPRAGKARVSRELRRNKSLRRSNRRKP